MTSSFLSEVSDALFLPSLEPEGVLFSIAHGVLFASGVICAGECCAGGVAQGLKRLNERGVWAFLGRKLEVGVEVGPSVCDRAGGKPIPPHNPCGELPDGFG